MIEPINPPNDPPTPAPVAPRSSRSLSRYLQQRKSFLRDRAITILATLAVLGIAMAAWRYYADWRLGRVILENNGNPLVAQLLPESGDEPVEEPFDIVSHYTLTLPAGDYRLRVNGLGRLGRTFRFAVNRGETITHELSLDDERLLGGGVDLANRATGDRPREKPIPFAPITKALELNHGRVDFIELNGRSVLRRDSRSGVEVWNTSSPKKPYAAASDPNPWLLRFGTRLWAIQVAEPAFDCNGDGIRDVLLASEGNRDGNGFIALSGQNGSMLWNYSATVDGAGGPLAQSSGSPARNKPPERPTRLIGTIAAGDVNADGIPDVIATLVFFETPAEIERRAKNPPVSQPVSGGSRGVPVFSRQIVVAISGQSGRSIWTFPLSPDFIATNPRTPYDEPATLVSGKHSALVAIPAGSVLTLLDAATGQPRSAPFDLGLEPVRPLQFADFTGDGVPEVLALGPGSSPDQISLTAFSLATKTKLWTAFTVADNPHAFRPFRRRDWPWLIDLDRDGQTEVIIPDSVPLTPTAGFRGLRVLTGTTGESRWVSPVQPNTRSDDGLDQVVVAPDLDGDGTLDVIAVSRFDGRNPPTFKNGPRTEPEQVYVDALSGRDGHALWHWHLDLPEDLFTAIRPPQWWGCGPDGWPLLALPLGGSAPGREFESTTAYAAPPVAHVLEASTGREQSQAIGLTRLGTADFDGDGLLDIWGSAADELRSMRGTPPEVWRALGRFTPALARNFPFSANIERGNSDFNADGIADTLSADLNGTNAAPSGQSGSLTAIARSGRDGRILWKTALDSPWLWFLSGSTRSYGITACPLPAGDFNNDGAPDVLVLKYTTDPAAITRQPAALPLELLSGRDGRHLWLAGPLPLGFAAHGFSQIIWCAPFMVEPDAAADLLVLHRSPVVSPTANTKPAGMSQWSESRQHLSRLSGRTGRIIWDLPIEDQPSTTTPREPWPGPPTLGDVDGDRSLDAVVMVRRPSQPGKSEFELKVLSLRDGTTRWSRLVQYDGSLSGYSGVVIGKTALNAPATLVVEESPGTNTSNEFLVRGLDGLDGKERWTWRSGVGEGPRMLQGRIDGIALDNDGTNAVCVTYSTRARECTIVILGLHGRELSRRVLPPERNPTADFPPVGNDIIDLDGDGRDELLVWNDNKLSAWGSDLKARWSFPTEARSILQVSRPEPSRPSTLILRPLRVIDGPRGELRWVHKSYPLKSSQSDELLDPGDSTHPPRLIFARNPTSSTVCQIALPATPNGNYAPPSGSPPPPGLAHNDPRWMRELPWTNLMTRQSVRAYLFAAVCLSLLNVFVPLFLLWLVAHRRPWSLRVLMVLPMAAAVPLTAFHALEPLLPFPPPSTPLPSSPLALFALGSAAGVPIVVCGIVFAAALLRRRWRILILLAGLTLFASLTIAAIWLWFDMRNMPTIEHYSRSGWELAILAGTYATGVIMLIKWPIHRINRWITSRAEVASTQCRTRPP